MVTNQFISKSGQDLYELGKLYFDKCDFTSAIKLLEDASAHFYASKNSDDYLESQNMLLRMYAEREDTSGISRTKEILQDLIIKQNVSVGSKTYYTLALCDSFKGSQSSAEQYLMRAIDLASQDEDLVRRVDDEIYARLGLVPVFHFQGKQAQVDEQLLLLSDLIKKTKKNNLKFSYYIALSHVLRDRSKFEQALETLWQAYEIVKLEKSLVYHIYINWNLGLFYKKQGDRILAKTYFQMAKKSLDPKELVRLNRMLEKELSEIGVYEPSQYDLVIDESTHKVIESRIGSIELRNQFVLLELLKLLAKNPGHAFSKEDLVSLVWKENYDPRIHDNKIYVTIKRLRQIIEPDEKNPKYIFRSKSGYYFDKSTRVRIESEGGNHVSPN